MDSRAGDWCICAYVILGQKVNIINDLEAKLGRVTSVAASGVPAVQQRVTDELDVWESRKETDPQVRPALERYWDAVGWTTNPVDPSWNTLESSAYISYILRDKGFPLEAAHRKYVEAIIDGKAPGWTAYSIPQNQDQLSLNVGDVLVKPRGTASSTSDASYWASHGDIVWQVDGNKAILTGGNISDTNKVAATLSLDENGIPTNWGSYKIVLKRAKKNTWLVGGLILVFGIGIYFWKKG